MFCFPQVLGRPSAELSKSMVAREKERVEKQAEELGAEGLKRRMEELKMAVTQNEVSRLVALCPALFA